MIDNTRRTTRVRRPRRALTAAACVVGVAGILGAVATTTAPPARAEGLAAPAAAARNVGIPPQERTVTLLTGDRLRVLARGRGIPAVITEPAPGRRNVVFVRQVVGKHLFVEPADALPLIGSGALDARFFDVTSLLAWHYDDAHASAIPVIAKARSTARPLVRVPGVATPRRLTATGTVAASIAKASAPSAWRSLRGNGPRTLSTASGATTLWLDGKRQVLDAHSRRQIGVPRAERLGLDGRGVRVAVLDTGVDPTHPDLAGSLVAARDFTRSPAGISDRYGHGTHVASVIAGSGVASSGPGRVRGVATGVGLVVGKVCGDDGSCPDSAILAGMQWAAATAKARVVNMSLGGADTPATDPLEAAVAELTERYHTLFVVAAGNSGYLGGTIESPGTAPAALTVGAVDADDRLADFSSRGPVPGSTSIKPDVTAPGVDIVAARAAGTDLGTKVGSRYVRLSGTSMATPHVAGAAAILLEQHPDWTPAEVKAALQSAATPAAERSPDEQGAGRVAVGRAVTTPLIANPTSATVDLRHPRGRGTTVTRTVQLHNHSAHALTVRIRAEPVGARTPRELFRVDRTQLTLAPRSTRDITVSVTAGDALIGRFGAVVTARAGRRLLAHSSFEADLQPARASVRLRELDRSGRPATAPIFLIDRASGSSAFLDEVDPATGVASATLDAGRYDAISYVTDQRGMRGALVIAPFRIADKGRPRTVVLDGRRARRVSIDVGQPNTTGTIDLFLRDTVLTDGPSAVLDVQSDPDDAYVTPVAGRRFGFSTGSSLWRADTTPERPSPYRYDVSTPVEHGVPATPAYRFTDADLARVDVTYHPSGTTTYGRHVRFFDVPGINLGDAPFAGGAGYPMRLPTRVTSYVNRGTLYGSGFVYGPTVGSLPIGAVQDISQVFEQRFSRRLQDEEYNRAVLTPHLETTRTSTSIFVPTFGLFTDAGPELDTEGRFGFDQHATGTMTLRSQGRTVARTTLPAKGLLADVSPDHRHYTLDVDARRDPARSRISTTLDCRWTFASSGDVARLALPSVRYDLPALDDRNTFRAGHAVVIHAHVTGSARPVRHLAVAVSYDRGRTWRPVANARSANTRITITPPAGAPSISLRAQAVDRGGNTVVQTVVDAALAS